METMEKVNLQKQYGLFIDGEWKMLPTADCSSHTVFTRRNACGNCRSCKETWILRVAAAHGHYLHGQRHLGERQVLLKIADRIDANIKHLIIMD